MTDRANRALTAGGMLLLAAALAGCAAPARSGAPAGTTAAPAPRATVCFDCFWQYQPQGFREELAHWYETHPSPDPLIDADRRYLLARVRGDREALRAARDAFEAARDSARDPHRRLLLEETVAFTAEECGGDVRRSFERAARAAGAAGQDVKATVYRRIAAGDFRPEVAGAEIRRRIAVPPGASGYILGESVIHVAPGERIGVQMERTVRDWLSYQLAWDFSDRGPGRDELIPWHEGSRLRDIVAAAPATIVPLSGILAVRVGERWLAADDQGVFRFEVLIDKVQYPTTRVYRDLALLVDSHGISSLVEAAVRDHAELVVGCGDTPYKAQAAAWLATRGIDVYMPCDRMAGDLIGYDGEGTVIGSAPVRAENGIAVIGDRPIRFWASEPVVAQDTDVHGGHQYYSAAAHYFRRLAERLPLPLEVVKVTGPDQAERVVARAEEIGAEVIALRVRTAAEAQAVRTWLAGSPARRAVLFHTAPYPDGYVLFQEFPGQTTFGDPRPRFLTDRDVAKRAQ